MTIDFGRTAADYSRYRVGFPDSLFDELADRGIGVAGQHVADVGTGTGSLARGFALRGCHVVGVDPAAPLLEEAKRLDRDAGVAVKYVIATAEQTGLADAVLDVYAAGQCWHWFDRPAAAAEARRTTKPSGALVICHFDWLPLAGNVVHATEQLILRHNPQWKLAGGTGMYPQWRDDVTPAGFEEVESFSREVDVPYSHEAWRGRIRASAGISASLSAQRVSRFDIDLAALLAADFPAQPLVTPHRVWALIARRRR